jgi:hypothetical protein
MKSSKDSKNVQGEGNYEAAKKYDESVQSFVNSGKVTEAVQKAQPATPQEAKEMDDAESVGLSHSKGEDPGVKSKAHGKP